MKRVIINADDFGYSEEINRGIIEAIESGLVRNTTILLNKPGSAEAIKYIKTKKIGYGLHLNLDELFYIESGTGKIISYKNPLIGNNTIENKIRKEFDQFIGSGLELKHLDSHHHTHLLPGILQLVIKLIKEYKIRTMRFDKNVFYKFWNLEPEHMKLKILENGIGITDYVIEGWFWGNLDSWQNGTAEIISHPGYGQSWREKELSVLKDRIVQNHINKSGIEVISYFEL